MSAQLNKADRVGCEAARQFFEINFVLVRIRSRASSDAVITRLPSGLKAALRTVSAWPLRTAASFPLSASHSRAVRLDTGRHPHRNGSDHELDGGRANVLSGLVGPPWFHRHHRNKRGQSVDRYREATLSGSPDPVPKMLRNEVMASRYVGNHRTRCDRLSNDPPLLLLAPPAAADDARDFRTTPNNRRVVTDVDHNVLTIHDPKRIASMHARSAIAYVRSEHRLP
jgi:hypothetical protein